MPVKPGSIPLSQLESALGRPLSSRAGYSFALSNTEITERIARLEQRISNIFVQLSVLQQAAREEKAEVMSLRKKGITVRSVFEGSQIELLENLEAAFIDVYPDSRVTAAVLRSRGRPQWMVNVRSHFVCLIKKWRPDITSQQLASNWGKDPTTIWHLENRPSNSFDRERIEGDWLKLLKKQGCDLAKGRKE